MDLPENPSQLAPALDRFLEVSGWSSLDPQKKMDLAYGAYQLFSQIAYDLKDQGAQAYRLVDKLSPAQVESFFRSTEPADYQETLKKRNERLQWIQQLQCFSSASSWTLHLLAALSEEKHFTPDQPVLIEFEPVIGLYLISGKLESSVFQFTLPLEQTSELHGESCTLPGDHASAYNLNVQEATDGLFIPKDRLLSVLPWNPELRAILETSAHRRHQSDLNFLTRQLTQQAEQGRLVQEILDNVGQASFSIDERGEIGSNYSAQATDYFGEQQLAGLPFADLILREDRKGLRAYYRALSMIFSGNQFDPQVVLELLPKHSKINGREFRLTYHFAEDRLGFVVSVFVQMQDITEELLKAKQAEETQAREDAEKKIQEKVRENIASFLSLLEMIDQNRTQLSPVVRAAKNNQGVTGEEQRTLLKQLHSIKGLCSQFELKGLRTAVHRVEGVLTAAEEPQPEEFLALHKRLEQQYRYAHSLIASLGEKIVNVLMGVSFTQEEFAQLKTDLLQDNLAAARRAVIQKDHVPVENLVASWSEDVQALGQALGKQVEFRFDAPENGQLPGDLVKLLNVELRHVYRNAVDHGIESPEQRESQGKPAKGTLTCRVSVQGNQLHLELEDDGGGINWEFIQAKALENPRIDTEEVQQLIQAGEDWKILFLPGFSSQEEVSEISGRGVGMDAVTQAVEQFKGDLGVSSSLGKGTRFWFRFPLIN